VVKHEKSYSSNQYVFIPFSFDTSTKNSERRA